MERLRQRLSRNPSYNNIDGFNSIDQLRLGACSVDDFKRLLREHGFYASNEDMCNIMDRFDKNKDGRVN